MAIIAENEVHVSLKLFSIMHCLKSTIHSFKTKYFVLIRYVWEQTKLLLLNVFMMCVKISSIFFLPEGTMVVYLVKVHVLLYYFNDLLLPAFSPSQELKQ